MSFAFLFLVETAVAVAVAVPQPVLVGRGVACAPTRFDPTAGVFPDEASLGADLDLLRAQGFRSLVTYAADGTLASIPRLARARGFERVYMGVFCPTSAGEVAAAIAESSWVDGYVVGNEGLGDDEREFCPYDTLQLEAALQAIRDATRRPVTTSEQVDDYLGSPFAGWLRAHGDWLFPNAHPFWAGERQPAAAVDWTQAKFAMLSGGPRPVVLKETGLPSAGCADCSETAQARFYQMLSGTGVAFFFFEAFDQPWKTAHPVEPHWGLNRAGREPKAVALWLPVVPRTWGRVKGCFR